MIKSKIIKVDQEVLDSVICDRCKKEIDIDDIFEIQEVYHIRFTGGYGSVFGDMGKVACDLCQHCLYDIIKDIYRIGE